MKKYLILLTKYNRNSNSEVIRLIGGLGETERNRDRKSYHGGLMDLLDHIASGALLFQAFLRPSYPELTCLSHEFAQRTPEQGKRTFSDFEELQRAIRILDDVYVAIAGDSSEELLDKPVTLETPYGAMEQTLIFTLMRYVNHCTHHRGQISQILDEMNVANDYSRMAAKYD